MISRSCRAGSAKSLLYNVKYSGAKWSANYNMSKMASRSVSTQRLDYPFVLTEGADDRSVVRPATGANKYHTKMEVMHPLTTRFRGSCTCNPPTRAGYDAAEAMHARLMDGEVDSEEVLEMARVDIKEQFRLPEGTGVFLMPSGSDAEYIPLLITKLLNPNKHICNIVTCNDEVGSGTLGAAGGLYFDTVEPIPGHSGGVADIGVPISGVSENVRTHAVPARAPSGQPVDSTAAALDAVEECASKGEVPIVHTVEGSKTGIIEQFPPVVGPRVKELGGMVVMDACQGRFKLETVHKALGEGACILITGSKFFRGPPFSGGVLVPPEVMHQLNAITGEQIVPSSMNTFMGKTEVPAELPAWRDALRKTTNTGLALRWTAAMAEIKATYAIAEDARVEIAKKWRARVIQEVKKYDNLSYFDSAEDTDTIVSIRIRTPVSAADQSKPFLKKSELAHVYKAMTLDLGSFFRTAPQARKNLAALKCFMGQPVLISEDEAVLRIALGSDSLRLCFADLDMAIMQDADICAKLSLMGNMSQLWEKPSVIDSYEMGHT